MPGKVQCARVATVCVVFSLMSTVLLVRNQTVALVCMVNYTAVIENAEAQQPARRLKARNQSNYGKCEPSLNASDTAFPRWSDGSFVWNPEEQGAIQSAFYIAYAVTVPIYGWIHVRYSTRHVIGGVLLIPMTCLSLTPTLVTATRDSWILMIVLRVAVGATMACIPPGMLTIVADWAPHRSRSRYMSMVYGGYTLGAVITPLIQGSMCSLYGWESIFYILAGVLGANIILWWMVVYDNPSKNPFIRSSEEDKLLIPSVEIDEYRGKDAIIPWKSIVTSIPIWAAALVFFCFGWSTTTIDNGFSIYLREVLFEPMAANSLIASLPSLGQFLTAMILSAVWEALARKSPLSRTALRKIGACTGLVLSGLCYATVGWFDCSQSAAVVACLVIASVVLGFDAIGAYQSPMDLAPHFAGILLGWAEVLTNITGFVVPNVIAAITVNATLAEWRAVFLLSACVQFVGAAVFAIFASAEEQEWSKPSAKHEQPERTELQ